MPHTLNHIPAAHRKLFQRCRHLIESLEECRRVLPKETVLSALSQLDAAALPAKPRRQLKTLLRIKELRDERQAELDSICLRAEHAAHRIADDRLRQIVKLYFLDGWAIPEVAQSCSLSTQAVRRIVKHVAQQP